LFFLLSKILVPLETPSDLLLSLLLLGTLGLLVQRFRRVGVALVTAVALAFLAIALLPVSAWVTAPLEDRFPRPQALPVHVDGIIVLGGAIDPETTARRDVPSLNSAAERMTEFVRLARKYPDAQLVFSGGSGLLSLRLPIFTESDAARLFFQQQGLDTGHILFENKSRNTYENVIFSKALTKPSSRQVWLLVSSARDMPRSVGIFRKAGWPVVAIPVSYKSDKPHSFVLANNLPDLDDSVHEWLGLLVYYLTGKTDALFPGPA
jgi:uncharacterized SAM-binding protein YcdF (DUF218 family)